MYLNIDWYICAKQRYRNHFRNNNNYENGNWTTLQQLHSFYVFGFVFLSVYLNCARPLLQGSFRMCRTGAQYVAAQMEISSTIRSFLFFFYNPYKDSAIPSSGASWKRYQGDKLVFTVTFSSHGLTFICTCATGSDSYMILAQFIMFPVWSPLIMSPALGCSRKFKCARRRAMFCKIDKWWVNKSKLVWQTWWWQPELNLHLVMKLSFLITLTFWGRYFEVHTFHHWCKIHTNTNTKLSRGCFTGEQKNTNTH